MPATTMMDKRTSAVTDKSASEDLDLRARKRMEVGLAPNRPTAKTAPMRPPNYQTLPLPPAVLALVLVGVVLVTVVLLAANLTGRLPHWWPTWTGLAATVNRGVAPLTNSFSAQDYELRLADDFSQSTSPLSEGVSPGAWSTRLDPVQSVYAIEVSPNHLAWSLLGLTDLEGYRLQTSVEVDADTPNGYAGLMTRYQDERHFYLFSVDGNGRYRIQQQDGDEVITVQPWTMAPYLNRAGSANLLTIEDDGERIRFYGNNMLIAEMGNLAYPLGYVGLAGGGHGQDVANIMFDWFQLYDAVHSVR